MNINNKIIRYKKYWLYIFITVVILCVIFLLKGKKEKDEFVFEKVKYGNIEKTVTCTGIINAKGTVEVGSRISGTINKLYVNYNDSVYTNKVMGVLDTVLLSKEYGEVMSLTNCTDYQARKLDIKCIDKHGNRRVLHTLNDTALATSRILVCILENNQQKDGSIKILEALWKYTGFKEIKAKK